MKIAKLLFAVAAVSLAVECKPESGPGDGEIVWVTASCDELGAAEMPLGACYLACSADADCPGGAVCRNDKYQAHCIAQSCGTDADCGPRGWECRSSCSIGCNDSTEDDSQSADCPQGYTCYANRCIKKGGGGSACGSCLTCYQKCSADCSSYPQGCLGPCYAGCDKCCTP